jgi:ligand-binding SRPBCC domain-containing protein
MRVHVLEREQALRGTPGDVFPFFADARNLEAITPPLLRFRVLPPRPVAMGRGTQIRYRLRLHGMPVAWRTVIAAWEPPHRFVDVQVRGPYALWHHTHSFEPHPGGTLMRDTVVYAIGFGRLGDIAHRLLVSRDLEEIFDFRRDVLPELLRGTEREGPRR